MRHHTEADWDNEQQYGVYMGKASCPNCKSLITDECMEREVCSHCGNPKPWLFEREIQYAEQTAGCNSSILKVASG